MKLFFDTNKSPLYLNLAVEVDEDLEGDANVSHLLEVKLMDLLQVDVIVVVESRVTDWLNKTIVTNHSISIDVNLTVEAEKLLKQHIDKLLLREAPEKTTSLKRRLKSAEDFLERRKNEEVLGLSSQTTSPKQEELSNQNLFFNSYSAPQKRKLERLENLKMRLEESQSGSEDEIIDKFFKEDLKTRYPKAEENEAVIQWAIQQTGLEKFIKEALKSKYAKTEEEIVEIFKQFKPKPNAF